PNKDEPKNGFLPDIDLAFEAVGSTSSVTQAMNRLKPGGACIWIGNSAKNIELDMQNIVTRELKVFGTYIYTYEEFVQSIGLISKLSDKLDKIISKIISLEEAPEIFNKLIEKDTNLIKVIIRLSS
ncbi:MAG: zinc-binding dehydrogenase, partial [bacterium]